MQGKGDGVTAAAYAGGQQREGGQSTQERAFGMSPDSGPHPVCSAPEWVRRWPREAQLSFRNVHIPCSTGSPNTSLDVTQAPKYGSSSHVWPRPDQAVPWKPEATCAARPLAHPRPHRGQLEPGRPDSQGVPQPQARAPGSAFSSFHEALLSENFPPPAKVSAPE